MALKFFSDDDFVKAVEEVHEIGDSGKAKPLPAGEYDWKVTGFKERETKNGKPFLELEYTVINDGKYDGRKHWQAYFDLKYFAKDLLRLDVDPVDFKDDQDLVIDRKFRGRLNVVQNGKYENRNVYVNERLDESGVPVSSADDEMPF